MRLELCESRGGHRGRLVHTFFCGCKAALEVKSGLKRGVVCSHGSLPEVFHCIVFFKARIIVLFYQDELKGQSLENVHLCRDLTRLCLTNCEGMVKLVGNWF